MTATAAREGEENKTTRQEGGGAGAPGGGLRTGNTGNVSEEILPTVNCNEIAGYSGTDKLPPGLKCLETGVVCEDVEERFRDALEE